MIKSILLPALAFLSAFAVCYLFAAFINAEIDFTKWSVKGRIHLTVIGGLLSLCSGLIVIAYRDINNRK